MKSIILGGGNGTRLYPLTAAVNKHFLQVYNKPLIYYSVSLALLAGSTEILIICKENDIVNYDALFGDGSKFGVTINYVKQSKPNGLPEALTLGRDFLDGADCQLILGDNILYGNELHNILIPPRKGICKILCYPTYSPSSFGIINFNDRNEPIGIVEKPKNKSFGYAIPGIYYFPNEACELASLLQPSSRGELEIVDLLNIYLERQQLEYIKLGRGIAWMDAGTPDGLLQASNFIQTLEMNQNFMIGCLEEIAFNKKLISKKDLLNVISLLPNGNYKEYLNKIVEYAAD